MRKVVYPSQKVTGKYSYTVIIGRKFSNFPTSVEGHQMALI
jgi:hypothetical protein